MANIFHLADTFLSTAFNNHITAPDGQLFDVPPTMAANECLAIFTGSYERDEIDILRKWFRPDHTIIDIGANIGVVSRYAFLEKLADDGTYICVEPNPLARHALEINMQRSASLCPKKNYMIIAAAVCEPDRNGKNAAFVVRQNLASALVGQLPSDGNDTIIQVPTRSLGSLMKDHAPNGASMICDAEGAEIPLIVNDPETFSQIRQIAIELHEPRFTGHQETPSFLISKLWELGFGVFGRAGNAYYLTRPAINLDE